MLARRLGRRFLDFDTEISRRERLSIAEIFARRGEAYFRQLEHDLTEELAATSSMVLAPGGGWMTRPETVAVLRPVSQLIYLSISPAGALRRMGSRANGRPLLRHPDPGGELERLLQVRRVAYETADVIVDVERLDSQRVTDRIQKLLPTREDSNVPPESASG
jgi:shikimate kinase